MKMCHRFLFNKKKHITQVYPYKERRLKVYTNKQLTESNQKHEEKNQLEVQDATMSRAWCSNTA